MSAPRPRIATRLIITSVGGVIVSVAGRISLRCPGCNRWKALADFGLRKMTPTGPLRNQSHCSPCRGKSRK